MSSFKTLDDIGDVSGKRVLVREDLNVPMDGARVTDDMRLRAAAPTIAELSDKGAIVLVLAHFGRPKGARNPDMSLALVTKPLSDVLGREVRFIDDCAGPDAKTILASVVCCSASPSTMRLTRRSSHGTSTPSSPSASRQDSAAITVTCRRLRLLGFSMPRKSPGTPIATVTSA